MKERQGKMGCLVDSDSMCSAIGGYISILENRILIDVIIVVEVRITIFVCSL